jgi:hypothetical protein
MRHAECEIRKFMGRIRTLAFMASSNAGTPFSLEVTDRSRSAGEAKLRLIRRSTALPGRPT